LIEKSRLFLGLANKVLRYCSSLPLAFTIARVFGLTIEEIFFPDDDAS